MRKDVQILVQRICISNFKKIAAWEHCQKNGRTERLKDRKNYYPNLAKVHRSIQTDPSTNLALYKQHYAGNAC